MPAHQRVSIEELKGALAASGGNVEKAARAIGMAPNNLRKRLEVACVDLNAFRDQARANGGGPVRSVRVRPDRFEALRQAAFDLAYLRRRDYGPEQVLEEFLLEAFEGWLRAKLVKPAEARP
jgi:hypothetical protein